MNRSYIPDIKNNPGGWFRYFDTDQSGSLSRAEITQALVDTLSTYDFDSISAMLDSLWELFDR